jgi:hypothetical protein
LLVTQIIVNSFGSERYEESGIPKRNEQCLGSKIGDGERNDEIEELHTLNERLTYFRFRKYGINSVDTVIFVEVLLGDTFTNFFSKLKFPLFFIFRSTSSYRLYFISLDFCLWAFFFFLRLFK